MDGSDGSATPIVDVEDSPEGTAFTLYSADGQARTELFYETCVSEHAVAYVSAHAVAESRAQDLLSCFETKILPQLPAPSLLEKGKLTILFCYLEGSIYGYTPLPLPEQGPAVCLNALYVQDFEYILAHEYQHLCAAEACRAGDTSLSENMDELLSDMFCERLFPGQGRERGILSEQRAQKAVETLNTWGEDGVSYVCDRLREGYSEEEILSAMENR